MSTPPGFVAPRQERSKRAVDRLIRSSIDLMSEGSFDEAPITRIIENAKCTVGTFYSRFDGKDALFQVVQQYVLDDAKAWVDREIDAFLEKHKSSTVLSVDIVTSFIVDTLYGLYTHDAGAYRAVFLHTRIKRDDSLMDRLQAFNGWCLDRASGVFARTSTEKLKKAVLHRWLMGLEVISAYLREQILFGGTIPTADSRSGDPKVEDLKSLYIAFLGAA